jgi:hypothetical protein
MKDRTLRCSKCVSTEDSDAIELTGLCAACADRVAIYTVMQELRRSYGWRDGSVNR